MHITFVNATSKSIVGGYHFQQYHDDFHPLSLSFHDNKIQAESLSIHPQLQKQAIRILINSKTVMKTISEVIDCFNVSKDDIPKEKKKNSFEEQGPPFHLQNQHQICSEVEN